MLTNVTCAPRLTVTFRGDTPSLVIVMVAPPLLPPVLGLGEVELSPSPHPTIDSTAIAAIADSTARIKSWYRLRVRAYKVNGDIPTPQVEVREQSRPR